MFPIPRFWLVLLLLVRPSVLFAAFAFVAGGVATQESPVVAQKIAVVARIFDDVLLPEGRKMVGDVLRFESSDKQGTSK